MQPDRSDFHEVFLRLFADNEAALRAYVRQLVPTRHDAADVMQEIALVLWRKFGDLDKPENFRRWAFGVARYEALAWLRDKARDRRVLAGDLLEVIADQAATADEKLEAQREALATCLEKLAAGHKALIVKAYLPDMQV